MRVISSECSLGGMTWQFFLGINIPRWYDSRQLLKGSTYLVNPYEFRTPVVLADR